MSDTEKLVLALIVWAVVSRATYWALLILMVESELIGEPTKWEMDK